MKKSRRQQDQRKRRNSRKPRISRGGAFHYLGHVIEAANICEHAIHLVKNVNKSSEVLTFCRRIDTAKMNKMVTAELIKKFTDGMKELTDNLKFISDNKVVTTIVSFTVRFFDGKPSSELQKLTASIPNAQAIAESNSWTDSLFSAVDAAKIIMWGEWYNTELTEATNNLIAVVTEMIGLQTLPMNPIEPIAPLDQTQIITEHYTKAIPPVLSEITRPPAAARTRIITTFPGRIQTPSGRPGGPGGTSFTLPA